MSIVQAIILGLVQGLTEFIPVSSSGHLVLLHHWLGVTENGLAFDVALHFGTLLALLLFFYRDIIELTKALYIKSPKTRLAKLLVLATIPAIVVGALLEDFAESSFRSPKLVAINLILIAILILIAERVYQRKKTTTKLTDTSTRQALAVGFAQALAVIPGVSRSGATITTGIFSGMDRVAAARFSFLLGIPIMIGAVVKVLIIDGAINTMGSQADMFAIGIITAFLSGLFAIKFLLGFLAKHSLDIFAYYRIVLGISVLALLAI